MAFPLSQCTWLVQKPVFPTNHLAGSKTKYNDNQVTTQKPSEMY